MLRLALRVRRADAELVLAELLELAPGGVEEVDVDIETVEYAVYGRPGELPEPPDLRAAAGAALVDISTTEVADDWADRWREFHRPLVLGDRLAVRPPWEPPQATALDLVIDPGRAFGTGAHATTRLCLELLLDLPSGAVVGAEGPLAPSSGPAAIDLGCGSGVLAIAAARLGHAPVLALDYDQLAVEATIANAAVNGVSELIEARCFDLIHEPMPAAPLVLANLLRPLLLAWATNMPGLPAHSSIVASGLLEHEADEVAQALRTRGYSERHRRVSGEWAALLLESPDRDA
ncbi:MAG TPA: 50S ribosomal protein L11 methyltransferase [Solirubrobacteraceae bacterium]|nr:50S ribosomal protein L11 methyltransferase [Solirubrobacteraceae bacterium]